MITENYLKLHPVMCQLRKVTEKFLQLHHLCSQCACCHETEVLVLGKCKAVLTTKILKINWCHGTPTSREIPDPTTTTTTKHKDVCAVCTDIYVLLKYTANPTFRVWTKKKDQMKVTKKINI
jgi:hypothetical protein